MAMKYTARQRRIFEHKLTQLDYSNLIKAIHIVEPNTKFTSKEKAIGFAMMKWKKDPELWNRIFDDKMKHDGRPYPNPVDEVRDALMEKTMKDGLKRDLKIDRAAIEKQLKDLKQFQLINIASKLNQSLSGPKPSIITRILNSGASMEQLQKIIDETINGKNTESSGVDDEHIREIAKEEIDKAEISLDQEDLEKQVKEAIEKAADNHRPVEIKQRGKPNKKIDGILPEEFEIILQLAAQRKNVLLVGPSGCGKTYIAGKVAEALSLAYASQSCSAGMSESMLAGWLIPVGAGGKFIYVSSQFVERYEKGGVFLLDELDAADPNTMVFFNQALAQDHFFLPQRHEKPRIKKHRDFICIAAANTFGNGSDMMFVGRNQLDAATLDRFRIGLVTMDYSKAVESKLVHKDVLKWGLVIREKIRVNKLRRIMSTRFMIDCTHMLETSDWNKEEWERAYFADWSEDEKRKMQMDIQPKRSEWSI